jgi:hypothetical protein
MKAIKKYPFLLTAITVIILLVLINSCNDSTTDNTNKSSNDFLFKVTVKNSAGVAVQGLRVSAYNDPTTMGFPKTMKVQNINAVSTINFALSKRCVAALTLYELDGTIFQRLITSSPRDAGMYAVNVNFNSKSIGARVYKAVLTAKNDTTNVEFFRDSIYVAQWQPDASVSVLGYTSSTGIFETADSLSFPNVLTLPLMTHTAEQGYDSIGVFTFPSDVVITLYDSTTQKSQMYVRKVNKGKNEFELVWNPTGGALIIEPFSIDKFTAAIPDCVIVEPVYTGKTRLYQNYPNPFN